MKKGNTYTKHYVDILERGQTVFQGHVLFKQGTTEKEAVRIVAEEGEIEGYVGRETADGGLSWARFNLQNRSSEGTRCVRVCSGQDITIE